MKIRVSRPNPYVQGKIVLNVVRDEDRSLEGRADATDPVTLEIAPGFHEEGNKQMCAWFAHLKKCLLSEEDRD